MKFKIKKSDFQYLLLYFMMIVNQSCLYMYFIYGTKIQFAIIAVLVVATFFSLRKSNLPYIGVLGALLLCTIVTRLTAGGIGLNSWIEYAIPLLLCICTVNYDVEGFPKRVLKIVTFFAGMSIVFYIFQLVFPSMLESLMVHYKTAFETKYYHTAYNYTTILDNGYGLLLHTFRENEIFRNKGLYTEPGVCEIVYNAGLFIALFMKERLDIADKKLKKYITILIIAIITVQSTTGYVMMGIMLVVFAIQGGRSIKGIRKYVRWVLIIAVMALIGDIAFRGENSFLYVTIIQKMFGNNYEFEMQSSGQYRLGAAQVAMETMIKHPLGVGFDNFNKIMNATKDAGGGAVLFKFGATVGIVPFLIVIATYLIPIFKCEEKWLVKIVLIILCFARLFAQSSIFYPFVFMFMVYYSSVKSPNKKLVSIRIKS